MTYLWLATPTEQLHWYRSTSHCISLNAERPARERNSSFKASCVTRPNINHCYSAPAFGALPPLLSKPVARNKPVPHKRISAISDSILNPTSSELKVIIHWLIMKCGSKS